jgi:Flp pilus assembly protein TadG
MEINWKYSSNERGSILLLTTLLLPILLVFIGLAVDGGLLWELKRRMQTSADSAALAGAVAKRGGGDVTAITNAARTDAATNGFQHALANVTVTVNTPPTVGPYAGNGGYVEAIVSQIARTHFVRLLALVTGGNLSTATVVARAVAGLEGQNCLYALNPTANNTLTLVGTPSINAPECAAYVGSNSDSAMHLEGQASLNLASIDIVGEYTCQGASCNNISPEPNTDSASQPDPLASLIPPTPEGSCLPSPASGSGSATLSPGRYCNGIKLEGIPSATFLPGTYYIEDQDGDGTGFRITSTPVVSGSGVFFYIASGQLRVDGSANVNFSAPTSGPYKGILFFQNRSNTTEVILSGGSQMNLNGAVYTYGAKITYSGGNCSTSPPKTLIVADRIEFVGHSCIARPDDLPPSAGQLVLAE